MSGQRNLSHSRCPKKCFTQIYRKLYGDAMLVPTLMGTNMADGKPTETSLTKFCYESVNLSLEELINIKIILLPILHKLFK